MEAATHGDRLMEILLQRKAIKPEALHEAHEEAEGTGTRLEKVLVQRNLVTGVDMALSLSEYLNIPPIQLSRYTADGHLIEQFSRELLESWLAYLQALPEPQGRRALGSSGPRAIAQPERPLLEDGDQRWWQRLRRRFGRAKGP